MKNIVVLLAAGLVIAISSHSFAQTTAPLSNEQQVSPAATSTPVSATPAPTELKPSSLQEQKKTTSKEGEEHFEENHPKFDKLADNHPKEANHLYNHREELKDKGVTGKDVYEHRSEIKHHEEKRAKEKQGQKQNTPSATPQATTPK